MKDERRGRRLGYLWSQHMATLLANPSRSLNKALSTSATGNAIVNR